MPKNRYPDIKGNLCCIIFSHDSVSVTNQSEQSLFYHFFIYAIGIFFRFKFIYQFIIIIFNNFIIYLFIYYLLFFSKMFSAYDQTRVKLNTINGDPHSEYINANIVMGYKERKKFVCAQGPMESTVYDFWRMAWEQRVEIIVMLTNVEEYNKTKCFQYWPDPDPSRNASTPEPLYVDPVAETQSNGGTTHSPSNGSTVDIQQQAMIGTIKAPQGDKTFGDIRVIHVKEKRYSEYVVRELQVMPLSDDYSFILEINRPNLKFVLGFTT
jgi:hypothetical protein